MSGRDASTRGAQLQQLQDEIDKLALLVLEAKKQSDRIQAAADALVQPIFDEFDGEVAARTNSKRRRIA